MTHKHGIVVKMIDNTDNEDYLDVISTIVSRYNILAAVRMTKRFFVFFSSTLLNDVERVVYQGIEVKGEHVHVDHYSKPANEFVISNVPKCFPTAILRPLIARKGVIVGEIKPIPHSSTKYRHIQPLRRSVTVILDRPNENLADTVDFFMKDKIIIYIYQHINPGVLFVMRWDISQNIVLTRKVKVAPHHLGVPHFSIIKLFNVIYNVTVVNVFNM